MRAVKSIVPLFEFPVIIYAYGRSTLGEKTRRKKKIETVRTCNVPFTTYIHHKGPTHPSLHSQSNVSKRTQ